MAADIEQLEEDQELEHFFPNRGNMSCYLHLYNRRNLVISAKKKTSHKRSKSTLPEWFGSIRERIKNEEKLEAKIYFEDIDADLAEKMAKLMEKFNFSVKKDELRNIEKNYFGKNYITLDYCFQTKHNFNQAISVSFWDAWWKNRAPSLQQKNMSFNTLEEKFQWISNSGGAVSH